MRTVDLRSDTVTQPTPRMRELMSKAVVGDDVYQEDPTVNQLEAYGAELVGKEAALFVASGTMGNLVALMTHTHPGEEVILEAEAHIYYYEVGGLCRIAGLVPHLLPGEGGIFTPEQLKKALRPANIHYPKTTLLCLENTHNRAGGRVLPQGQVEEIAEIAKEAGLKLHLDGARIFNAAAASGIDVKTLAAPFDSVMFCLSKGLAAPAGSLLAGSAEFIARARKNRKILGGGMRQAGVLAAAGLESLEVMTKRLREDHQRAKRLAERLGSIPGLRIAAPVETNIIMLDVTRPGVTAEQLVQVWSASGIKAIARSQYGIRLVTHYQIDDADVDYVVDTTSAYFREL